MEVVNTLDIDGSQWELQDVEARNKIATIEDSLTVKDLPDLAFNKNPDYSYASIKLFNHYSFGKLHFVYIRLQNVSGSGIGTATSAKIGSLKIKPKKETSFIMYDYISGRSMRCYLEAEGNFYIGESLGVSSGNNVCFGELIFAEA